MDNIQLHDIDGDGRLEELLIAGHNLVVLDAATGEDRWIFEGQHIQTAGVGNFLPDREGLEIFCAERRLHGELAPIDYRGYMVDCQGNELWRKDKAGYGRPIKLADREADYVFIKPPDRPYTILDGQG
ncbi:MAG: hypothetical protein R6V07_12220, partial [Armatimonadota bacterium]